MDRCRCDDYARAVAKIRFFTVGTYRPAVIDSYDRSGYVVKYIKNQVDFEDLRFEKPEVHPIEGRKPRLSRNARKIEQMWCPYMSPIQRDIF